MLKAHKRLGKKLSDKVDLMKAEVMMFKLLIHGLEEICVIFCFFQFT